jgi:hypothetical protein
MSKSVLKSFYLFSIPEPGHPLLLHGGHKWAALFDIFLDIFGTNDVAIRDPVINRCQKDDLLHICWQKQA